MDTAIVLVQACLNVNGPFTVVELINSLYGVGLLVITVGFFFSGTVLKWGPEGYEAYQHALESIEIVPCREGVSVFLQGTTVVMRMFTTHVLILPLLLILFVVPHLALIN
jgi:quinol-cytochrome oxidoreductase complex cytochrome b subunit